MEAYIRLGDIFTNQNQAGQIASVRFWNEPDGLHGEIAMTTGAMYRTGSDAQARRLIDYLAAHSFNTNVP